MTSQPDPKDGPPSTRMDEDRLRRLLALAQEDFARLRLHAKSPFKERWGATTFAGGWSPLPEGYLHALAELVMDRAIFDDSDSRVVPPEADDGAEADSFDAFHKALTDEAKQFGIDPTVVQALAAALTAPHAWLWSRLEAANRQADAYASTERDLRAKLQLLIDRPEVTPEGYYCFPDGDTWWRTGVQVSEGHAESRPNE